MDRNSPKIQEFVAEEVALIKSGGRCSHEAFVRDTISGHGFSDLAKIDPPVVGLSNNDDVFYVQYFKSREEVEAFIVGLRKVADQAWPAD